MPSRAERDEEGPVTSTSKGANERGTTRVNEALRSRRICRMRANDIVTGHDDVIRMESRRRGLYGWTRDDSVGRLES